MLGNRIVRIIGWYFILYTMTVVPYNLYCLCKCYYYDILLYVLVWTQYMVIIKSRWVVVHEWKVLLCELKDHGFWCLPWGTLEWWESIEQCCVREFEEELGVTPQLWPLMYINQFGWSGWTATCVDFWFMIQNSKDFVNLDWWSTTHAHELNDVQFIDLHTTSNIIMPESIGSVLHHRSAHWRLVVSDF